MSTIIGDIVTVGGNSSSSGDEIYALIKVTYPESSLCTLTNGINTLTAEDTSGQAIFGIPEPTSTPETWTVSCTDGTNSDSTTISITLYGQIEEITLSYNVISNTLNDNSWAIISAVSLEGTGDTYWDVGDCKAITLNGTVGTLALSNVTLYVFILDFNHPINKTTADNNIIWGGFKTAESNGIDVALCDASYNSYKTDGTKIFNMNHRGNYNYGGWKGCDFRYDILGGTSTQPSGYTSTPTTSRAGYDATAATISSPVSNTLMAALPSDLRAILRLWDRYIDFKGNMSNIDANCSTKTVDAISLLAPFEIFGSKSYANQYEHNHQKQMAYYSTGNSKIKYKHNATNTACYWWEASPDYDLSDSVCCVFQNGNGDSYKVRISIGLAPAFRT